MLKIINSFQGKNANDTNAGDLNGFLRAVLVEVAGENYRQTMYEAMALASADGVGRQYDLDPPLRGNERVLSGLFATAISRVALRSRTEVRVDRSERDDDSSGKEETADDEPATTAGRVDYLAWYANRVIGIELKMATMNCQAPKLTAMTQARWESAVLQAKSVQNCLKSREQEDRHRYQNPISLALMVIVGRRAIRAIGTPDTKDLGNHLDDRRKEFEATLLSLEPRPTFLATYTFPEEFRFVVRKRKGRVAPSDDTSIYTPFVSFIAKPAIYISAK